MKTITTLHDKIVQRERIELSGPSGTSIAFLIFLLFTVSGLGLNLYIFSEKGFSPVLFVSLAFFALAVVSLLAIVWKSVGTAYIKGDMLIVRYPFGKYKVTELRSIRSIKSAKILGLRLTAIRYKIDGESFKVFMFGNANYIQNPKTIINTIRKVA